MSVLVTAAEEGSLSAAARRLGIPLTTVSRKVSELEAYLKTTLLTRSSRRLTLTDAGRSYVADCKRILEDVEEAERAASGEYSAPKGDLIITAPIVFGRLHVLPVIAAFLKDYPDINIQIVLADRMASRVHARIERRRDKFFVIDQSTNGTFVTFAGEAEVVLRREEVMLRGQGRIAFGHSLGESSEETVDFVLR